MFKTYYCSGFPHLCGFFLIYKNERNRNIQVIIWLQYWKLIIIHKVLRIMPGTYYGLCKHLLWLWLSNLHWITSSNLFSNCQFQISQVHPVPSLLSHKSKPTLPPAYITRSFYTILHIAAKFGGFFKVKHIFEKYICHKCKNLMYQ